MGIFKDPDRLWNMDEEAVCAETGQAMEVFSGVKSHHGGLIGNKSWKKSKHITAVVVVSASGRCAPPIFNVSGKHVMRS